MSFANDATKPAVVISVLDRHQRDELLKQFSSRHCNPLVAEDCDIVVRSAIQHSASLVIADLDCPGERLARLAAELFQQHCDSFVAFVSASPADYAIVAASRVAAIDVLSLPISQERYDALAALAYSHPTVRHARVGYRQMDIQAEDERHELYDLVIDYLLRLTATGHIGIDELPARIRIAREWRSTASSVHRAGVPIFDLGYRESIPAPVQHPSDCSMPPSIPLQRLERMAITNALKHTDGNVVEAAKLLGLGQATVYRKVKKYNISLTPFREIQRTR